MSGTSAFGGLDRILALPLKQKVGRVIRVFLQALGQPTGWRGYLASVFLSVLSFAFIVFCTGLWNSFAERSTFFGTAFKSTGPLIIAVVFKFFVWDYLLAVKSYWLLKTSRPSFEEQIASGRRWKSYRKFVVLTIGMDLLASALLTSMVLAALEYSTLSRSTGGALDGIEKHIPFSLQRLFDEIHITMTGAAQRALDFINGTLGFYLGKGAAYIAGEKQGIIDWSEVEKSPFSTLAIFLVSVAGVVTAVNIWLY